jgi:hypothetical protein
MASEASAERRLVDEGAESWNHVGLHSLAHQATLRGGPRIGKVRADVPPHNLTQRSSTTEDVRDVLVKYRDVPRSNQVHEPPLRVTCDQAIAQPHFLSSTTISWMSIVYSWRGVAVISSSGSPCAAGLETAFSL